MIRRYVFLALVTLSLAKGGSAAVWRVTIDGSGDAPTIQAAIDAAESGDTIHVGPGRYTWSNQGSGDEKGLIRFIDRKHHILLRGEAGAAATILDAEYENRTIYVQAHNHITVDGFSITGGRAPFFGDYVGGGFFNHISADTIKNCIFANNRARYGGGISSCGNGYVTVVDNCIFTGNIAERSGGGVFFCCNSVPSKLRDCRFTGNAADDGGGGIGISECPISIEYCLIAENEAQERGGGIACYDNSSASVRNCTIARNTAAEGSGVCVSYGGALDCYRSIFAFNTGSFLWIAPDAPAGAGCCDCFGNTAGDDFPAGVVETGMNIALDPRFCGVAGSGDYYLRSDSPCIPVNHPGGIICQQIGAYPAGCGANAARGESWSGVKSRFKNPGGR
jgi:hypothetical protein